MKKVLILVQVIGFFYSSAQMCQRITRSYDDGGFRAIGDDESTIYGSNYRQYYEKIICDNLSGDETISSYQLDGYRSVFAVENRNIGTLTFASMSKTISEFYGIKLNNNCINSIKDNAFTNLTQVREINLKRNNLSSLPDRLFASNVKLEAIDLSYNSISIIGKTTFHSPLYLYLQHNRMRNLNFQLPATLKILDLSTNLIRQIPKTFFKGLSALEVLSLGNNSIQTLPAGCFQDLNQLRILSFANNKIHSFPKHGTFSGLYNIQTLNFANNSLEAISGLVTHSLENVDTLNIENNQIHVFDTQDITSILRKLLTISISGNSFNCSHLKKVLIGFTEKNIKVNVGHEYSRENIKGIACSEANEEIKVESVEEEKEEETSVLEQAPKIENKEADVPKMTLSDLKRDFANFQNVTTSRINAVLVIVTLSLLLMILSATLILVVVSNRKRNLQFSRNTLGVGLVEANNL